MYNCVDRSIRMLQQQIHKSIYEIILQGFFPLKI